MAKVSRSIMNKLLLIISDSLALFAAYLGAYHLRNNFEPAIQEVDVYLQAFPYVLLVFLVIFWINELYKSRLKDFDEVYKIVKTLSLLLLILMAASFLQKFDYSRAVMLIFWPLSILTLIIERKISRIFAISTKSIARDELPDLKNHQEGNIIFRITKTLIDFTLSLIGIFIFSPIWIVIAVLIKLDSRGPVIFKHKRVGKNGKKFILYKFRTMFDDVDHHAPAPIAPGDTRITRFGKLLRKTSLDEAPQFINVLKGEMSIVGPRPEMPFIVNDYTEEQLGRLKVKPGITGLWQILGRKDIPLKENLQYDFYYIKNRSLLLDLVIMIKTIGIVITGKGAY